MVVSLDILGLALIFVGLMVQAGAWFAAPPNTTHSTTHDGIEDKDANDINDVGRQAN